MRVGLVSGPSGAGKSRLCRRLAAERGWTVLTLDDFYRDAADLPADPDWDDIGTWDAGAALAALHELARTGRTVAPVYSLPQSRRVGSREIVCAPGGVVLAEGIFAAHLVTPVRDAGWLADAWCVRNTPWVTFVMRLVRDLAQRRKAPTTLVRRGLALRRLDRAIVARDGALGARPLSPREARAVVLTTQRNPLPRG